MNHSATFVFFFFPDVLSCCRVGMLRTHYAMAPETTCKLSGRDFEGLDEYKLQSSSGAAGAQETLRSLALPARLMS